MKPLFDPMGLDYIKSRLNRVPSFDIDDDTGMPCRAYKDENGYHVEFSAKPKAGYTQVRPAPLSDIRDVHTRVLSAIETRLAIARCIMGHDTTVVYNGNEETYIVCTLKPSFEHVAKVSDISKALGTISTEGKDALANIGSKLQSIIKNETAYNFAIKGCGMQEVLDF